MASITVTKKTKTKNQRAADKNHMERNKAAEGSFNMVSDHRSVWSDLLLSASWRLADGFSGIINRRMACFILLLWDLQNSSSYFPMQPFCG